MPLTAQYKWIEEIRNLPKMVAEGIKLLGTTEYPGLTHNNPVIMGMAKDLHIADIYPNDEMPWCALSHSWICLKTGKPLPGKREELYRAKSFTKWGIRVSIPMFGDTLVFERDGGFHVGMYIGEDATHYHVMGGNQGNSYSIMRIEKKRLISITRYYSIAPPDSVKQIKLKPEGLISNSEA